MGDKKQKEAMIKTAKQVLVVGACVLFVVLMILSGMGSSWLTMFTVIKPGDNVVLDYTMYDAGGNPVLTSSQQTYTKAAEKGRNIIISRQLSMVTGKNLTSTLYPVMIYTSTGGWSTEYALFSTEYDAINGQLVGMKTGDQKRIRIPNSSMVQEWSAVQLSNKSVDINELSVGDFFALGVSSDPEAMMKNESKTYTRIGEIVQMTNESVMVDLGYPSADISIVSINAKN
jgi:FKBP-type peptidyl-prolyl cis-trans isomerase 2